MTFIPYLAQKDLKRINLILIVWILLLGVQTFLGVSSMKLAAQRLDFQMTLPWISYSISLLQNLMLIVLVPLIVHEDAIVGSTAFWMTRPFTRKGMLVTKALLIFCLFVLLPLLAEVFVLVANGMNTRHILLAVPEVLLERLAFVVPFYILAAVTPKLSHYAFAGIIILVSYFVFMILLSIFWMFAPKLSEALFNYSVCRVPSLEASIQVMSRLLIILMGSLLIMHQYLTRRSARTIRWVVVMYAYFFVIARAWNVDFLKPPSKAKVGAEEFQSSLTVAIDQSSVSVSDEFSYSDKDERRKRISMPMAAENVPEHQFAILTGLSKVRVAFEGQTIKGYGGEGEQRQFSDPAFMGPIQAALKGSRIVNPYTKQEKRYIEVLNILEKDYELYKRQTGRYTARATYDIYEYEILYELPFKKGMRADYLGSDQSVIYDILKEDTGVSCVVGEKRIYLLFDRNIQKRSRCDPDSYLFRGFDNVYVLVNEKRQEAFLPQDDYNVYADMMAMYYSHTRLNTLAKKFHYKDIDGGKAASPKVDKAWFSLLIKSLDGVGIDVPVPKIDEAWMKDAKLIRLKAKKVGTTVKDITLENFSFQAKH